MINTPKPLAKVWLREREYINTKFMGHQLFYDPTFKIVTTANELGRNGFVITEMESYMVITNENRIYDPALVIEFFGHSVKEDAREQL